MHNRSPSQNNTAPKPLFPTEISTRACRVGSGTPGGCDGRRSVLRDPCQPCAEAPFSRGFHLDACRAAPGEARRGERRLLGAGFEARGAAPARGPPRGTASPAAPQGGARAVSVSVSVSVSVPAVQSQARPCSRRASAPGGCCQPRRAARPPPEGDPPGDPEPAAVRAGVLRGAALRPGLPGRKGTVGGEAARGFFASLRLLAQVARGEVGGRGRAPGVPAGG